MNRTWGIVLGAAVLGGLSFAVYQRNKTEQSLDKPKVAAELPTIAVADDVDKISLKDGKKGEVLLEKKGDKWVLTKPVSAPANQQAVKDLLANLKDLKVERAVDLKLDDQVRKDKKLDADQAMHVIAWKGADKKAQLTFGANQLVAVEGKDGVFVAKGYSSFLYAKEAKDWRDKEIFKFDDANATHVTIDNKAGAFSFTKGDKGWAGTFKGKDAKEGKPIDRFDEQKVKDLLLDLKSLNAEDFGDAKPVSETGLDAPEGTITVSLKDNAGSYVLKVGKPSGNGHFANRKDDATVFVVGKQASEYAIAEVAKFQKPIVSDAGAGDAKAPPAMPDMPPGMMPPGMDPHGGMDPRGSDPHGH